MRACVAERGSLVLLLLGWAGCAASQPKGEIWPLCEDLIYEEYEVKAVDARTGAERWVHGLGRPVGFPSLAPQETSLLVSEGWGGRWCFELPSGDEIGVSRCEHVTRTSTAGSSLPDVYYHPRLALASGPFEVHISAERSVEVKVAPTGFWRLADSVVLVTGDGLTESLGELAAFRSSTGDRRWSRRSGEPGRITASRVGEGLAALLPGGRILLIDARGEIAIEVVHEIKQPDPSLWESSTFIDMGDILLLALYRDLVALDRSTLALLWSVPRNTDQIRPVRWNDLVIFGVPREMRRPPYVCTASGRHSPGPSEPSKPIRTGNDAVESDRPSGPPAGP